MSSNEGVATFGKVQNFMGDIVNLDGLLSAVRPME